MPPQTDEKPGCLGILFSFLKLFKPPAQDKTLPYRLRDDFLSPAEFSFYKVLSAWGAGRFVIQSKVHLADIFFVARSNEKVSFRNKIVQRHLDFLICDPTTMKPMFGIELDDSSHQRRDRQDSDAFLNHVFQSAQLPLLRIRNQRSYTLKEIADQVTPLLEKMGTEGSKPPALAEGQPEFVAPEGSVPLCPKCSIPMVLKTAAQGPRKGNRFYGCPNFPRCRERKNLT
jgi:very-short-patch-repair endonuclease